MAAIDQYSSAPVSADGPANRAFSIVPNDGTDLEYVTTALYVGGAGDISLVSRAGGAPVILKAVPVGTILPIRVSRVRATGTTATNLVGLA
jgi:hypothetical protein